MGFKKRTTNTVNTDSNNTSNQFSSGNQFSFGFQTKTINNHDTSEVVSALQKCIRRGLEEDALYWASELDLSGFGKYCWKRLRVIASEDIGIADSNIAVQVESLFKTWTDFMKEKKPDAKLNPDRMFLCHAVILMCRAKKSRIIDHAMSLYWKAHSQVQREIPDFALDKHTLRGKQMGRSWDHFFNTGTILENESDIVDEYKDRAKFVMENQIK